MVFPVYYKSDHLVIFFSGKASTVKTTKFKLKIPEQGWSVNFVDCCKDKVVFKRCLTPKVESGSRSDFFTSAYSAGWNKLTVVFFWRGMWKKEKCQGNELIYDSESQSFILQFWLVVMFFISSPYLELHIKWSDLLYLETETLTCLLDCLG